MTFFFYNETFRAIRRELPQIPNTMSAHQHYIPILCLPTSMKYPCSYWKPIPPLVQEMLSLLTYSVTSHQQYFLPASCNIRFVLYWILHPSVQTYCYFSHLKQQQTFIGSVLLPSITFSLPLLQQSSLKELSIRPVFNSISPILS